MEIDPCEHPVSMQLFGSEPDLMAEVAKSIEDRDFDILDINMGCPVPKVVNNGEGSALLKNPNLIEEIVRKVSSAISKPLTVKVRIGFENEPVDIVEIAKRIEDAGAAALAVHGRTRQQYYSGTADWDTIRRVKEAITIPVIGNGDVDSPLKAEALVKQTGCDAVMVGRAVRGNPWLFRELNHYFRTGELLERPSVEEIREMILRHARKQIELKGEFVGIRDPGFQIDALAAHHGLVNVVAPQCLLRLVADERQRFRLEPPAGQEDRPALHVAQLHDQLDRIRDDGQVFLFLEPFCQI